MKQFIISLLLLLLVFVEAHTQTNKIDSLQLALKNAANDTIRMDVSHQLGHNYSNDSSDLYWVQAISIAKKLKLKLYEANLLNDRGYRRAWDNYPEALEFFLQALKIAEDPANEQNIWNLTHGKTAHDERLSILGKTHFDMSFLYGNTGNTEKQILSLLLAKKVAESIQDSGLNMLTNLNLGNVYFEKYKKLDSALYFEQRALSLFSKSAGGDNEGWVFSAMGEIYKEKGDFYQARDAFLKGLRLMQEYNNLVGVGGICISLSNFYQTTNKPDSSLLYANKALETYKISQSRSGIANAYSLISSAFDKLQKKDSAFIYLKLATVLHDSLNNLEKQNLLGYQSVSFDEQMRVRNLEDEKIQTKTKIRTYAMLAGIVVFMVIAFLLYRNSQHRKKANELLQKQKAEIADQKDSVEQTLLELKSTQTQLIQSEKMASLGELTAGIAHEIQNPLNFVNNFSEVSNELIDEMNTELDKGDITGAKAIATDVKQNLEKINHHGQRAAAIVKAMLQHSRRSSGVKEPTDINALCDEYLRLSYHGLRAKDKLFNATMKTDFDESLPKINIIPQDIGRVVLNLINNAFYAVNEKQQQNISGYEPTVTIKTTQNPLSGGRGAEIKVSDNGNGIPPKVVDKIFQPFFTTKPTGQGTGLGLSLSYDIIKAHGGELKVETKEGEGAEFVITLPD